jgi:hypothetical protein
LDANLLQKFIRMLIFELWNSQLITIMISFEIEFLWPTSMMYLSTPATRCYHIAFADLNCVSHIFSRNYEEEGTALDTFS